MKIKIPGSIASCHVHRLSRKETVLGEHVDILAELRQSAPAAHGSEVEQRQNQRGWEAAKAEPGPPFAVHRLQVGEACSACQRAAPHQTVTQDGPLEKLTGDRKLHYDITPMQVLIHTNAVKA